MSMYYFSGFDLAASGAGTMQFATSGHTTFVIDLTSIGSGDQAGNPSSRFFHYFINGTWKIQGEDPDGTTKLINYSAKSFGRALRDTVRAAASIASWGATGSSIDITPYYSITCSASITITFSNSVGAALLGFTSLTPSSGTFVTSNATPSKMIQCTLTSTSNSTPNYEPAGIATHAIADDGSGFGLSRQVTPLYRDWVQQYELKAKVLRLSAVSSHPYNFQSMFEDCRGEFPFITSQGFGESFDECFSLRSEGTTFKPEYAGPDKLNGTMLHVPFRTIVEGKVVQTS